MKIVLIKKHDGADKEPLLIQYVVEDPQTGRKRKVTEQVALNQEIELDDDVAFEVIGKYRGLFRPVGFEGKMSEAAKGYAHKAVNAAKAEKSEPKA